MCRVLFLLAAALVLKAEEPLTIVQVTGPWDLVVIDRSEREDFHQPKLPEAGVAINGGFFDHAFDPVGFFRFRGQTINQEIAPKLSGFVVIYADGSLVVEAAIPPETKDILHTFQSGPFLIDPGGKMGIYSEKNVSAKRAAIGVTHQGALELIYARGTTLYALAQRLIALERYERVLNLDGGPSSGLYAPDVVFPFKSAPKLILLGWLSSDRDE